MSTDLKIIRPAELAEILNCSRVTIWRMRKRGELPPKKKFSNRCTGWLESDIEEWLENSPFADPEKEEQRQAELAETGG